MRVDELFYAGSSLDKALTIFSTMVRHWPRLQLTILARIIPMKAPVNILALRGVSGVSRRHRGHCLL
jgi:hypothetical protein